MEIPLIGSGFQAYINNLFCPPPFSSSKQAFEMLAKTEMTDDNWIIKRAEIADAHLLERALQDLSDGRKAWLAKISLARTMPRPPARRSLPQAQHQLSVRMIDQAAAARTRHLPTSCGLQNHIKASTHNALKFGTADTSPDLIFRVCKN